MQATPYLFFNGNCADALNFYAAVLGGEIIVKMPASELPPEYPVADDRKDWVLHSELQFGDSSIFASDSVMGETSAMSGCSVMLSLATHDEAQKVFDRLADGGEVEMPFAPTFWSSGFGTLSDRFGINWMIGADEAP
ncbi:MAG: VOC family protein [Boseongicola sp.]